MGPPSAHCDLCSARNGSRAAASPWSLVGHWFGGSTLAEREQGTLSSTTAKMASILAQRTAGLQVLAAGGGGFIQPVAAQDGGAQEEGAAVRPAAGGEEANATSAVLLYPESRAGLRRQVFAQGRHQPEARGVPRRGEERGHGKSLDGERAQLMMSGGAGCRGRERAGSPPKASSSWRSPCCRSTAARTSCSSLTRAASSTSMALSRATLVSSAAGGGVRHLQRQRQQRGGNTGGNAASSRRRAHTSWTQQQRLDRCRQVARVGDGTLPSRSLDPRSSAQASTRWA